MDGKLRKQAASVYWLHLFQSNVNTQTMKFQNHMIAIFLVAALFVSLHAYVYRTRQVERATDLLNQAPRVSKFTRKDNWSARVIYWITCLFI